MTEQELHANEQLDTRGDLASVVLLSLPMVVTTCSPMILRVTDFAFISQLGKEAQAAIIPTQIVLWSYMAACIGLVTAVNTFAAQALGRNRFRDCSAYAWQSLYVSIFFGLIGIGLLPFIPYVFSWIGHEPQVLALEVAYAQVSVWAILPTIAAQALGAFFNGVHKPRITMLAAIEGSALNIALNYVLIFGKLGFPELGFTGAALGTVIATYYQLGRLLWSFWSRRFHAAFGSRHTRRLAFEKMRGLLRVGVPQGLHWFSDVTVWAVFSTLLIGRFGTVELAASNIAWQYIRISFMPMIGLGQALTSLVGRAIGRGQPPRAIRQTRFGIVIALAYIGLLSIVYALGRRQLIGLFTDDDAVLLIGMNIMLCMAVFQVFDIFGMTYYHALRGAGDTTWPMIMLVTSHWLVVIGGGYAVALTMPELGSLGPWMVATVLITFAGALMWWRWYSRAWMKIDLFKYEPAAEPEHQAAGQLEPVPVESQSQ